MNVVYANRALGILKAFLELKKGAVDTWLLPSTCCFSIPFLFKSLGLNVAYYDFDFDTEYLMAYPKAGQQKLGLLLVDYYGISWSTSAIEQLKTRFSLLIHDACLSDIDFSADLKAKYDLKIFSTGKGKTVDLNGGALGFSRDSLQLGAFPIDGVDLRYQFLDQYWKNLVAGEGSMQQDILTQEWVDCTQSKVAIDYQAQAENKLKKLSDHRKTITAIYTQCIPAQLQNFAIGAWRYSFLVDKPEIVLSELQKNALFASRHYANVANRMEIKSLQHTSMQLNSDLIERHIVNLFNDFNISINQAELSAQIISTLYHTNQIKPIETHFKWTYATQ